MKNLKYSVGIDISKADFKVCFVVINELQQLKVLASSSFDNTKSGFAP